MIYQLTVNKNKQEMENLCAHARLFDIHIFPFSIGYGKEPDCSLDDFGDKTSEISGELSERKGKLFLHCTGPFLDGVLNARKINLKSGEELPLKNGDRLELDGALIRVYRSMGRPGTSFLCNVMFLAVVCMAIIFFMLQIVSIGVLPLLVEHSSSWNSYRDRQEIFAKLGALDKEMNKELDDSNLIEKTVKSAMREEVALLVSFINDNYNRLTRTQRKKMTQKIEELYISIGKIKNIKLSDLNKKQIDIDACVEQILSNHGDAVK